MIDYLILTKTDSEKRFRMTMDLIDSLQNTVYPNENQMDMFRITLIENCVGSSGFKYPSSCDVIEYDTSERMFNYNHALNLGVQHVFGKYGSTDWFCVLNNDVICEKDWMMELSKAVIQYPEIESICPNIREKRDGVLFGYQLFKHLDGCCIMHRKSVLDKIGMWDELFDFAYQDDDYLERMRLAGVVHAKVLSSKIIHLGTQTCDYTNETGMRGVHNFIKKYSYETLIKRENEKHSLKNEDYYNA